MPRSINTAVCDGINDGNVQFRLLCTNTAAAGLIGHSGMIINCLSAQTSSKIHVDKTLYSLNDRLVYVTGSSSLTRTIRLAGEEFPSSAAIEAVIRVFERLLESEAESGAELKAEVKCRMLVEDGMVGALMGKGGEKINEVSRASGAVIEVSNSRAPPLCGGVGDRLIVIEGSCLAVKKALVLICQRLQMKLLRPVGRAEDTTYSGAIYQSKKIETRNVQLNKSVNGRAEVVFKLLCSYQPSGFVIGPKGVRVRALQEETGASIYFSSAGTGCYERVVPVSAFENRKMQCSIAQNAIVRVSNEIVSFSTEEVPAGLLVRPNQSDWLSAGEVPIISAIQNATGATLQVWELNYTPAGAADDEKVLEIDGDYHNVQAALLQVCWELRKSVFETSLAKKNTPLFPHELLVVPSIFNEIATLRDDMIKCTASEEVNGSQVSRRNCLSTSLASPKDLSLSTIDSLFDSSNNGITVTNTKLEIAIRADVFSAVYGDNGCNLSRLRLISGATVEVHDPCSGNEGIVILSGTRDQTLVAQSLLQAFLNVCSMSLQGYLWSFSTYNVNLYR